LFRIRNLSGFLQIIQTILIILWNMTKITNLLEFAKQLDWNLAEFVRNLSNIVRIFLEFGRICSNCHDLSKFVRTCQDFLYILEGVGLKPFRCLPERFWSWICPKISTKLLRIRNLQEFVQITQKMLIIVQNLTEITNLSEFVL
jgi:hypothetical protein